MNSKKLSVITISITTFNKNGAFDEAAYRKHLRRLRDGGVSVFVAGSGSGEGYTLDPEEVDRILAIAIEELKGKVGVYADGCEPRTTKEMVRYVRRIEPFKVDAVRIMPLDIGHKSKPSKAELDKYCSSVINATSSPVLLTSHHAAGYLLPLDLIESLCDRFDNITGINYGGDSTTYLAALIKRVGDRIDVHCAGSSNGLATLGLGGNGFMGNEGNLTPALCNSVIKAYQAHDEERLRSAFAKLMSLAEIVAHYGGSSLRGLKPLLNELGLPSGPLREPRMPLDSSEVEKMRNAIIKLEIPELSDIGLR